MKALALTLVAAALVTTACSTGSQDDPAPAPSTTSAATAPTGAPTSAPASDPAESTVAEDDALALTTSTVESRSCFSSTEADLGLFETTWEARTDLSQLEFRLTGSTGLAIIGTPLSIPPRNFGGRIDYSGAILWSDKSPLATSKDIVWSAREDASFLNAIEDQTGLLLFHLRFDDDVVDGTNDADLGEVVARYTTDDGQDGTLSLDLDEQFGFGGVDC